MYKLYKEKCSARLHYQTNMGGVIHNHCIALHKRYYRMYGKYLSPHYLKAHIAKLNKLQNTRGGLRLARKLFKTSLNIDRGY